jgi:hypothetical protein
MRRSRRCSAATAQHPAGRRAQLFVLPMRTAKPTTRPPLAFQQFGSHSLDVLAPRFSLLRPEHPAEPLIAGKRREVFPRRKNLWAGDQDASQVGRHGMDHSARDNPGTHRPPILAPTRTPGSSRHKHRLDARSNRHLTAYQPASRGQRRIPAQAKLLAVKRSHHLQTELAVAPRVDVRAAEFHI